jgi:hypothetical protein
MAGVLVGIVTGFSYLDVERRFLGAAFRCPFAVAKDFGRNLRTASDVSPGHVVKKLLSMAWVHVDMGGLKQAL